MLGITLTDACFCSAVRNHHIIWDKYNYKEENINYYLKLYFSIYNHHLP